MGVVFLAGALRSPFMGLAAVAGLAGVLAVVREPGIGMGVLTFLIPLERMQRITNDDASFTISLLRLVAIGCLGSIVLRRIHRRQPLRLDRTFLYYGIYVGFAILGLTYTTDPSGTKRFLGTILSNCLFVFLYYNYLESRRQVHLTIAIWMAATLLGAGYSAYDWHLGSGRSGAEKLKDPAHGGQTTSDRWSTVWEDITEWDSLEGVGTRRSAGPTSHPTVYGINLILTVPVLGYLLRRHSKAWQQALLFAALGLVLYNILLTNTRGTFLVTALTLVLCLTTGLFTVRRWHLAALLILAGVLVPFVPKDALQRALDPRNYTTGRSVTLSIRFKYWDAATRILGQHYILGVGVGNERAVPEQLPGEEVGMQSVHNIYLQVAIETGIVGWVSFFTFVGLMLRFAWAAARDCRGDPGWRDEYYLLQAIQVAMIAVLAFGIQVDVFNFPLKGWWLLVCATLVLYRWREAIPRPSASLSGTLPLNAHPASA